jgi:Mg2+ and Co2+ transporter CorA
MSLWQNDYYQKNIQNMKRESKYIFLESDKDLMQKIQDNINIIDDYHTSQEKRESVINTIQNFQNELNFRLATRSAKTTKRLSIITIVLTILTVVVTTYMVWNSNNTQKKETDYKNQHIKLLEQILDKLQ